MSIFKFLILLVLVVITSCSSKHDSTKSSSTLKKKISIEYNGKRNLNGMLVWFDGDSVSTMYGQDNFSFLVDKALVKKMSPLAILLPVQNCDSIVLLEIIPISNENDMNDNEINKITVVSDYSNMEDHLTYPIPGPDSLILKKFQSRSKEINENFKKFSK